MLSMIMIPLLMKNMWLVMAEDYYKNLVREAWKSLGIERFDERDFLTAIRDLVNERDALQEEVTELRINDALAAREDW